MDPANILLGILSTIALGISGWALIRVVSLGERCASLEARVGAQEGSISEVKATLNRMDAKLDILAGLKKDK